MRRAIGTIGHITTPSTFGVGMNMRAWIRCGQRGGSAHEPGGSVSQNSPSSSG